MKWVEEDRPEVAERIVDGIIAEMTLEQLRQYVWDHLYDQMVFQNWDDLWAHAERYAPETLEIYGVSE